MPLPKKKSQKEKNHLKKKYLGYGRPKAGKTTFFSNFGGNEKAKTLFFPTEPGHSFVEIYKWTTKDGRAPENWMHFVECCRELYDIESHDFRLLCVDTVDILWKWCTEYVCKTWDPNPIKHPSEVGFGKAYQAVQDEFSNVCNKLGQRGMGFVFLSHEKEYEIQIGPRKESCVSTSLPSGAQKFIHGFVDYIWYFHQTPEGKRMILTDRHDNINAGSRGDINEEPLPLKMPMNPSKVIELLNREVKREGPIWFDEEEEIDI